MATTIDSLVVVPAYASNGSVSAVALGGSVALTAGGWIENHGQTTIYLVGSANVAARADPVAYGKAIPANRRELLPAGITLADYGLLSDGAEGAALVLGT